MLYRRHLPSVSRVLIGAVATFAALGLVNCTSLVTASRDGTLDASFVPSSHPGRMSLSDVLMGANGTYIGRILFDRDSTMERWPNHVDEPLHVWIDSNSTIGGTMTGFPAAVREAFSEWAATGIPLRFTYVNRPGDADIRVRWTDHLERKTGSTTWKTDRRGWLTSADITLATHVGSGDALDARGMQAIALHEVGHALGLSHSDDGHDIMAPLVRVTELSQADRSTMKLLYSFNAGRVGP
jgi:hypothetical protein